MFNEPVRFRQYKGIRTYATYHYNGSSRTVFKSPYGAHLKEHETESEFVVVDAFGRSGNS